MRSVKLTSDQGDRGGVGDVIADLDDGSADFLVDNRFAVEAGDDLPGQAGTRTVGEVVSPMLTPDGGTTSGEPTNDLTAHTADDGTVTEPNMPEPNAGPRAPDPNVADGLGASDEYDPKSHTVAEVNGYLDEQREAGNDDEVARVLQLEDEGRSRAGILDA